MKISISKTIHKQSIQTEPMVPAKLDARKPTAVRRDWSDQQQITDEDQTGTNTEQAGEEYHKRGITKIRKDSSQD